jgi:hypothetical protein
MRTHPWKIAALMSLTLGFAALASPAAAGDDVYTVGELAVRLAHDLRLQMQGDGADVASAALTAAGVTVSGDLARPLREKELTEILNQLGLHLTTSRPERAVEEAKLDRLLELLLAAPGTEGEGGDSTSDQGYNPPGGGFGRSKSVASPHDD